MDRFTFETVNVASSSPDTAPPSQNQGAAINTVGHGDTFIFGLDSGKNTVGDSYTGIGSSDSLPSHDIFADFAQVLAHVAESGNDFVAGTNVVDVSRVAKRPNCEFTTK